jgi:hypothetical protein
MVDVKRERARYGELIYALPYSPAVASFTAPIVCGQCDELLDKWRTRVERELGRQHIRLERFGPCGSVRPAWETLEVGDHGGVCNRNASPASYEVICEKCPGPESRRLHFRSNIAAVVEIFIKAATLTNTGRNGLRKSEMQIVLGPNESISLRKGRALTAQRTTPLPRPKATTAAGPMRAR